MLIVGLSQQVQAQEKSSLENKLAAKKQENKIKGNPKLPSDKAAIDAIINFEKGTYKYSVEDFFKEAEQSYFEISPDGKYFSYMKPIDGRPNIFVEDIATKKTMQITNEKDDVIAFYTWANNNRIIYGKDKGGDENYQAYAVDADGKNPKALTPYEETKVGLISMLRSDDDHIIIELNKENPQIFEPYKLNLNTAELTKLADNKDPRNPISGWIADHEGNIKGGIQTSGTTQHLLYKRDKNTAFRKVFSTTWKDSFEPLFCDFENSDIIYAISDIGRDKKAVVKYDLSKGKELEVLFQHPTYDANRLSYSWKNKDLTFISYNSHKREYICANPEYRDLLDKLNQQFGDKNYYLYGRTKEEDKFLVYVNSDQIAGQYYLYDRNKDDISLLFDTRPHLKPEDMATMKPIRYKSRDGLTIHAFLTIPNGVEAKNLEVVVNPHGGPYGPRDMWRFDGTSQLLASRGYAVFQINYRGSGGYGKDFFLAGSKQIGRKMLDDLEDGVKYLIDKGIAAPSNVGIYGGSYGGLATLGSLVKTPDMYRCGIDYVGVSNLFTFYKSFPPYWKPYLEQVYAQWYDPKTDEAIMKDVSPALNADKITKPLFVVQGANDPRVKIGESDQIVENLRARGVDVPYLVKYDEGHGFSKEENRIEFFKAMLGFFAKHLRKPKG